MGWEGEEGKNLGGREGGREGRGGRIEGERFQLLYGAYAAVLG